MSNKFLTKKKPVEVVVNYLEFGDEIVVINDVSKFEGIKDQVKQLIARFRRINNGTYSLIMQSSIQSNEDGTTYLNPVAFKNNKLKYLFISMTDYDGEVYTASQELFNGMDEDLAVALVDAYDQKLIEERLEVLRKTGIINKEEEEEGLRVLNNVLDGEVAEVVDPTFGDAPKTSDSSEENINKEKNE